MIPVTKPFLPPRSEFDHFIDGIWQRNWLTNNGPLVNELELKLKERLAIKHLLFLGNGTIAIQIALKALGVQGKVITTPFSYVATASSIFWENCEPVFVDIQNSTFNIDVEQIEGAVDDNTSAIVATHCFGNACNIDGIMKVAAKKGLKVIFDGAHCFGTKYNGKSVFEYGDVTTISFHSTKLFHTIEGGAVVTPHADVLKRMAYMRNFGHDGPEKFNGVGINGKNSEFHAAMGLCNLNYIDAIMTKRREQSAYYDLKLKNLRVQRQVIQNGCDFNYAYYPVVFESEQTALDAKNALERQNIFPRRYFYPTLSTLDYMKKGDTPIADSIASRILCLPLYHTLSKEEQDMIARILLRTQQYAA